MTTATHSNQSTANRAIETLKRRYGADFAGVFPQQKAIAAAVLLAHIAKAGDSRISIETTIKAIDRDGLLGDTLSHTITQLCQNYDARQLSELAMLLAARHADDTAAGAYAVDRSIDL